MSALISYCIGDCLLVHFGEKRRVVVVESFRASIRAGGGARGFIGTTISENEKQVPHTACWALDSQVVANITRNFAAQHTCYWCLEEFEDSDPLRIRVEATGEPETMCDRCSMGLDPDDVYARRGAYARTADSTAAPDPLIF